MAGHIFSLRALIRQRGYAVDLKFISRSKSPWKAHLVTGESKCRLGNALLAALIMVLECGVVQQELQLEFSCLEFSFWEVRL